MSAEDDIAKLAQLGPEMAGPDLDADAADRIARRARDDLGKGPDPRRLVVPVVAAAITIPYAVWVVVELLRVLG